MDRLVFDIEIYSNYFLVAFKNILTNEIQYFECRGNDNFLNNKQIESIEHILKSYEIFGFNSINFDIPILLFALSGQKVSKIKYLCDKIITENLREYQTLRYIGARVPSYVNHFDIQDVADGVYVSLKTYGARLHSKKLQDLPFEPDLILTASQMDKLKPYCLNDLNTTVDLYRQLEKPLKLRRDMGNIYGVNLMSKSKANIAEVLLRKQIETKRGARIHKSKPFPQNFEFAYIAPKYINFSTKELSRFKTTVEKITFKLNATGHVEKPSFFSAIIKIGDSAYKWGLGGLHSTEKSVSHIASDDYLISERDVVSYYPSLIINTGIYPKNCGEEFLSVYKSLRETRVKAKKDGKVDLNKLLKIELNGTFGKLASKYSVFYSPKNMVQVTLTGQLCLLMLIESLEINNISVVSANTDGIVAIVPHEKYVLYEALCKRWEKTTQLTLEETLYSAIYSRDVNSYLAIKTNGSHKGRGLFNLNILTKNPICDITTIAAIQYLKNNIPISKTILQCTDITKLLVIRSVKGGGCWRGKYLGETVRWVYVKAGTCITYKKNGNKVATSDGAFPVMDLSESFDFSKLDYDKYISIAEKIVLNSGGNFEHSI